MIRSDNRKKFQDHKIIRVGGWKLSRNIRTRVFFSQKHPNFMASNQE